MATPVTTGLPPRFYQLSDAGTFERVEIHRYPLIDVDSQLRAMAQDIPNFLPRQYVLPDFNLPVHMLISGSNLTHLVRLPSFKLSTYYTIRTGPRGGSPAMVPVFKADGGAIRLTPDWTPPSDMALFFLSHFTFSSGYWAYSQSSLVAISLTKNVNGIFKLPLPNVYANCKLCLGREANETHNDAQMLTSVVFAKSLAIFQNSNWNTDMISENNLEVTEAMFRFSAEDNKTQLPVMKEWAQSCIKANNNLFTGIPFNQL